MVGTSFQQDRLQQVFPNGIPMEIEGRIQFFRELDRDYRIFAENHRERDGIMFSPKHIKDKSWTGLWLHATGMDSELYINWIYAGWKYKEYQENTLVHWYREAHPREKYTPYSIVMADQDLRKILNKEI